jgi:phage-related protein
VPLDSLNQPKVVAKCLVGIELLKASGNELRRPTADILRDGIYELRIGFRGMNYRLLYFFHGRQAAVISHGIVKESKVPSREIDRALVRMNKFKADPKRHTHRG